MPRWIRRTAPLVLSALLIPLAPLAPSAEAGSDRDGRRRARPSVTRGGSPRISPGTRRTTPPAPRVQTPGRQRVTPSPRVRVTPPTRPFTRQVAPTQPRPRTTAPRIAAPRTTSPSIRSGQSGVRRRGGLALGGVERRPSATRITRPTLAPSPRVSSRATAPSPRVDTREVFGTRRGTRTSVPSRTVAPRVAIGTRGDTAARRTRTGETRLGLRDAIARRDLAARGGSSQRTIASGGRTALGARARTWRAARGGNVAYGTRRGTSAGGLLGSSRVASPVRTTLGSRRDFGSRIATPSRIALGARRGHVVGSSRVALPSRVGSSLLRRRGARRGVYGVRRPLGWHHDYHVHHDHFGHPHHGGFYYVPPSIGASLIVDIGPVFGFGTVWYGPEYGTYFGTTETYCPPTEPYGYDPYAPGIGVEVDPYAAAPLAQPGYVDPGYAQPGFAEPAPFAEGPYQEPWAYPGEPGADEPLLEAPAQGAPQAGEPAPQDAPLAEADGTPPTQEAATFAKGVEAFLAGRYAESQVLFALLSETQPEDGQVWLALTHSHFARSEYAQAATALARTAALGAFPRGYRFDPHPLYPDGSFDEKLARLRHHTQTYPLHAEAWLLRGYFEVAMGDGEAARVSLDRVTALRPTDATAPLLRVALEPAEAPPAEAAAPLEAPAPK